jgi:hypothetical protein
LGEDKELPAQVFGLYHITSIQQNQLQTLLRPPLKHGRKPNESAVGTLGSVSEAHDVELSKKSQEHMAQKEMLT